MATYIALLRGINVSGQKQIKMADLKVCLEEAGLQKVRTYIQSGNVVFEHESFEMQVLTNIIEQTILERFGFEVHVILTSPSELETILTGNPFLNGSQEDTNLLYFTFLSEEPAQANIEALSKYDYSPEAYSINGKLLYFFAANGYGKAKMNNNFIESKLKLKATTRNWNTINKLVEIAQQ
ncbi:DUF1697 domain-containing protein [Pontibacter vulgaris]|uniref:DUF1697 domain-containing protein n=1 Tax=Pontibacter vulgaris TaxID=2905679 RepID=UPI001FA8190F|nr:DUF1697 domain-containing protein [Pontibacter vulgaris]